MEQNPDINWKTGELSWRKEKKRRFFGKALNRVITQKPKTTPPKPTVEEIPDEEEEKNHTLNPTTDNETDTLISLLDIEEELESVWLNAKTTTSNEFHIKHDEKK